MLNVGFSWCGGIIVLMISVLLNVVILNDKILFNNLFFFINVFKNVILYDIFRCYLCRWFLCVILSFVVLIVVGK